MYTRFKIRVIHFMFFICHIILLIVYILEIYDHFANHVSFLLFSGKFHRAKHYVAKVKKFKREYVYISGNRINDVKNEKI